MAKYFSMSGGSKFGRESLGSQLAALRERAGKSLADVRSVGTRQKIWRMESGRGPYKFSDIRTLCFIYGADEATTNRLTGLAEKVAEDNIWLDFDDVLMSGFEPYLHLEANAAHIRTYDAELIHGLLQTPEYHRVIATADGNEDASALARDEELRQLRQHHTWRGPAPCRITAIFGEAALHRVIGSREIMTAQLGYLRELSANGATVQMRVLTWEAGAHAGLRGGAFTWIEPTDPEASDVVYLESETDGRYLDKEPKLQKYRDAWSALTRQSISLEEYVNEHPERLDQGSGQRQRQPVRGDAEQRSLGRGSRQQGR